MLKLYTDREDIVLFDYEYNKKVSEQIVNYLFETDFNKFFFKTNNYIDNIKLDEYEILLTSLEKTINDEVEKDEFMKSVEFINVNFDKNEFEKEFDIVMDEIENEDELEDNIFNDDIEDVIKKINNFDFLDDEEKEELFFNEFKKEEYDSLVVNSNDDDYESFFDFEENDENETKTKVKITNIECICYDVLIFVKSDIFPKSEINRFDFLSFKICIPINNYNHKYIRQTNFYHNEHTIVNLILNEMLLLT